MNDGFEKRQEERLNYNWPIWFAENYDHVLAQGQMVDISSKGAAFTCYADRCPQSGEEIMARFSVPSHAPDCDFDLENFIRKGYVCRIEEISNFVRKVAIQFAEPLPFKPAEIICGDEDEEIEEELDETEEEPTTFEEYEKRRQKLVPAKIDKAQELIKAEACAMAAGHTFEDYNVTI